MLRAASSQKSIRRLAKIDENEKLGSELTFGFPGEVTVSRWMPTYFIVALVADRNQFALR